MSVAPGHLFIKDPNSELLYHFDWTDWLQTGAEIASYTLTVDPVSAGLTYDNDAIEAGGKKVQVRVIGGTLGKKYNLECKIVTNETPTQTDERSVDYQIRDL